MSSEVFRLESLLEITSSKRIHLADYVPSGVPFFRGKEVIERAQGNSISTELFITNEKFQEIKTKFGSPQDGDILLTSVGTLGVAYFINGLGDFYFKDGNVTWFRNFRDSVVPKFLYYWITSPATQKRLDEIAIGSTQRALTISALKSLEITLPCVDDQIAIVEVLDSLSDRITLLRETNQTLEAIAQALFKSWFVDFDPVRAKAEGKLPDGMDAATAALFPDAFEETELGMVPRGWGVNSLSAFITECSSRIGAEQAIVLSAVQTGNLVMSSDFFNKRVHSKDISKYKAVQPYSYAYNPSRINIGSIGMNEMGTVGAVSPIYVVFNPNDIAYGYYLWHLLKINRIRELIKTMSSGTVRQSLSFKDFASIKVALPTAEIVQNFFEMRHEIFKAILEKEERISLLTNLRDTLLPPLITGQMRISEAKAELEKVIA